ncbi:hypothetical protein NLP_4980 [Nostoc sp. 'Lobaria pulmonaria (5183) cyanobiont']|nr:hypothetical protein NLP_4980 [Nostoc sp. 'Lobaria pulmonaria (5183) cyanobiont']
MLLRKESHFLHSRNNFISPIQTKPPLVTSSKFLLSREQEPSIQPLIGWDTQDINSEFPLLEFDSSDSITPLENSNTNSRESVKDSIPEIMPTRIVKKTSNNISQKPNIPGKAKSKITNKSQQPSETKSKSRTKKPTKSSAAKNVEQSFDESNITINRKEDSLLASDEPLSVEGNSEIPILQLDIASGNTTNNSDYVSSTMPSTTAPTSPIVEKKSSLLNNISNNTLQENSEVTSSVPSANPSLTESILPLQKKIGLKNNTNELVENSPREFTLDNNVEEILTSDSNLSNQVIPEASQVVNISDIPVSPTPSEQDIETSQTASIVDNQTTASQTNSIQAKEVPSSVTSALQSEELPHTNSNCEAITAIEPDLISESIENNFVRDNAIVDNPLTLSSALTSPDVDDAPSLFPPLANDKNTVAADVAVSNSESSVAKSPIAITATSSEIGETPSITATSPEIGETAIAPLRATSPEIGETPTITATSPEIGETAIAPLPTTSPETGETPTITATSPEIGETPTITATSPEIGETAIAPLPTTSPEIGEIPTITATSPEIGETAIAPLRATSPEIGETPTITTTSPEIGETAIAPLPTTSPEIGETPTITATSSEISETAIAPKITATSSEIGETAIAPLPTTSPEIGETPTITATSPEIGETAIALKVSATSPEIFKESEQKTSPETPTKVDSFPDTSLQLKSAQTHSSQVSNSLIPSSLGLDIGRQKLSILNSPQLNPLQNETIHVDEPSPQYSSPPLIFRKANPSTNTSSQWSNTPSQWSSVEDLLNGNNDEFTSFNFSDVESNSQNYESSHVSESPQVFAKHLLSPRGFADGGEVTLPDISREIEPITETIESVSSSSQEDDKDDTADLEALAREIYNRLRQRIEIERERHGGHSGRLPW